MTFGKFSLFVILPSSILASLIVVLIGLKAYPALAAPVTIFVEKEGLELTHELPQSDFDETGIKFYLTGEGNETVNITGIVFFYSFVTYAVFCYLFLTLVFYFYHRIKKIEHKDE